MCLLHESSMMYTVHDCMCVLIEHFVIPHITAVSYHAAAYS